MEDTLYDANEARIYDAEHASLLDEEFWLELAANYTGGSGSILELGCGTLRIGMALIKHGYIYCGIDASIAMLERAGSKLSTLDPSIRSKITLLPGDFRNIELGEQYDLIIAPLNSFLFITQPEEQLSFLRRLRRLLTPNGHLALDIFIPHMPMLTSTGSQWSTEPEIPLQDTTLQRDFRIEVDSIGQILTIHYRSKEYRKRILVREWTTSRSLGFMFPRELILLLKFAGYDVENTCIDYDFSNHTPTQSSISQVFVAKPMRNEA